MRINTHLIPCNKSYKCASSVATKIAPSHRNSVVLSLEDKRETADIVDLLDLIPDR